MDIDSLTLGQIKQLQGLCGGVPTTEFEPFLGQYVIVRTYSAGVFAGIIKQRIGKKILLENSRMLWRFNNANNGLALSETATYGINQANSKICCVVSSRLVQDIEIIACTDVARKTIEGAKDYVA